MNSRRATAIMSSVLLARAASAIARVISASRCLVVANCDCKTQNIRARPKLESALIAAAKRVEAERGDAYSISHMPALNSDAAFGFLVLSAIVVSDCECMVMG